MQPSKNFFILIVVACVSFIGCKKENQATPQTLTIFPLKTGNTWSFQFVRNDSVKSNHVNEVIGDTLIGGQTWFILTYDTSVRTVCKNTTEGWWFMNYPAPTKPGTPALYYRYPAQVNDQYMTIDSSLVTVVSTSEKVTVAAGTFTCYHYHMIHYLESYECEEFFSPGTGLIKHVVYEPNTGTSSVKETATLISCKLNVK